MRCARGLPALFTMAAMVAAQHGSAAGMQEYPPALPAALPPAPTAAPARPPAARPKLPRITLGKTTESTPRRLHGAADFEYPDCLAKADGNHVEALLIGSMHAHAYVGGHARGSGTVHLIQEFTIKEADPARPFVRVDLDARVEGYLRTDRNGTACLQQATVQVRPVSGGTALNLSISPGCVAAGQALHVDQFVEHPPTIMPAGDYILEATLVFGASVDGVVHGQGEAVFTPGETGIVPGLPDNPFVGVDRNNFGFQILLTAE